jgi:hypothetical protein
MLPRVSSHAGLQATRWKARFTQGSLNWPRGCGRTDNYGLVSSGRCPMAAWINEKLWVICDAQLVCQVAPGLISMKHVWSHGYYDGSNIVRLHWGSGISCRMRHIEGFWPNCSYMGEVGTLQLESTYNRRRWRENSMTTNRKPVIEYDRRKRAASIKKQGVPLPRYWKFIWSHVGAHALMVQY